MKRYKKGDIIPVLGIFPDGSKKVEFVKYCKKGEEGYIEAIDLTTGYLFTWTLGEISDSPAAKILYGN